jgi:hypothetical protein
MNDNRTFHLVEFPLGGKGGFTWNRLHGEPDGESPSGILIERLNPFDTVMLRTHNSDYRLLLLDPGTGRALVEGGSYLPEPSEGLVNGSALPGSAFNDGAICVGGRLEMWVDEKVFLTSPIKTVEVRQNAAAESLESI